MNLFIWNVKGLNHPSKQKEVQRFVRSKKIGLVCLVETKLKEANAGAISSTLFPDWEFSYNYEHHYLGRIWLCWSREDFVVTILHKSDQCITCIVHSIKEKVCWHQTYVYCSNNPIERRILWQHLLSIKLRMVAGPWLLCGDFKSVRFLEEKWGLGSLNSYQLEFHDCLNTLEVVDLNFSGCFFTWSNKSEGDNFVARKLDRVLVNEEWLCQFGRTCVDFPTRGISDHSPAVITVGTLPSFGPKPFKFYNYWLENKDYMEWLSNCWNQEVRGVPMYRLSRKMKAFKAVLKGKNKGLYRDIRS
jgi:exonuclease III